MTNNPKQVPVKFKRPEGWHYPHKREHPLYMTTSSNYGGVKPTSFEMPTSYYGHSSKFSNELNASGPYRNFSLNS